MQQISPLTALKYSPKPIQVKELKPRINVVDKVGNVIFETTAKANESDKYDWKKRVAVSLSPTEVADLLIHLESGSSYSVSKNVRAPREWTATGGYSDQEGAEYNVALTVTGHKKGCATFELAKDDEKPIATEMTAPELYVFKRCMDFSLPYLTGFAGVLTEDVEARDTAGSSGGDNFYNNNNGARKTAQWP